MGVISALAKLVAAWVTVLSGKRLSDFSALVAGMRTWLLGNGNGGTERKAVIFAKKHGIAIAIVANAMVAVLITVAVSVAQHKNHPLVTPTTSPSSTLQPSPTPSPSASEFNLDPQVRTDHWVSWAILDRKDGLFAGSENWGQAQYAMSSIKPWIAADYLNSHPNPSQDVLESLSEMILDSNDEAAYAYFAGAPSLDRFVAACGITDIVRRDWSWSLTELSARDSVRYLDCIYSGKATSPQWTAWIVDLMRHVRGEGDFGVRELFNPKSEVATKNGWYDWEGKWYINCLAITDDWAIAILQQFPSPGRWSGGDLKPGIEQADPVCTSVAQQVLRLNA